MSTDVINVVDIIDHVIRASANLPPYSPSLITDVISDAVLSGLPAQDYKTFRLQIDACVYERVKIFLDTQEKKENG
jgi:hypothetical protein